MEKNRQILLKTFTVVEFYGGNDGGMDVTVTTVKRTLKMK